MMKPQDDQPLERIREEQAELKKRLAELDRDIAALVVQREASPALDETSVEPASIQPESTSISRALTEAKKAAIPPPLPPPVGEAQIPKKEAANKLKPKFAFAAPQDVAPAARQTATPETVPETVPETRDGLELKLGTYWLVRIGIVMLLTGFVFLVKHFLTSDEVAAGLKVTALYLLSAALLLSGAWIGKTRESMRNYGEVLGAGGFAAVYFTTFAAHKVPGLAVISSPLIAGVLLLSWAGVMVYIADRMRSQTLAVMGVLLAYYTLLIDEVSLFSLFSALILSGVALVFLVRNRWTIVGSLSLAGTYLAFAYWRFPELLSWLGNASPSSNSFWPAYGFLICYWAVFTAAVFLSDHLAEKKRSALAGLNNAAFLVFFGLGMGRHYPDQFWIFTLIAGFVFLALSEVADRRLGRGALLGTLYLAKGIVLITLAFFLKLSGYSLAILIAAESGALLVVATCRRSKILEAASYISAVLAVFYTIASEFSGPEQLWFVEFTDGIPALAAFAQLFFFTFSAWWLRNHAEGIAPEARFEPRASIYLVLGMVALLFGAYSDIANDWRALVFVGLGAAAAALGSWRRLKLVELAVIGQAFSAVAAITFLEQLLSSGAPPLAQSILVLLLLLGLLHWAVDTRGPLTGQGVRVFFEWSFALVFVASLLLTVAEHAGSLQTAWLYLPGSLALPLLFYGYRMRIPALAILSQAYHPFAMIGFASCDHWILALFPLLLLLANIFLVDNLCRRADPGNRSRNLSGLLEAGQCLLRVLALLFFAAFVFGHLPEIWQASAFALAALVVHALAIRSLDRQRFVFALILLGTSAFLVLFRDAWHSSGSWQTYLAALTPLGLQQISRRGGGLAAANTGYHRILATASVGLVWLVLSIEVDSIGPIGQGFYLIISWTFLGLLVFAVGWFLRERIYRLLSLVVVASALVRLLAIEVWGLEPIARIITFILIGVVLLSLGFIYTRYQDKLRRIF